MIRIPIKRYIRSRPIVRLDMADTAVLGGTTDPAAGTGGTGLPNSDFLSRLSIDQYKRLKYDNNLLACPLFQEDW